MRRDRPTYPPEPGECRIHLWEGYVSGQFYARVGGAPEALAVSPSFRTWRPPWQEPVRLDRLPAAKAALAALVDELSRRGWRTLGASGAWYEHRLVRARPTLVVQPAPEPVPPDIAEMTEASLLHALQRLGGEDGATAADLGRALFGDGASTVRLLPQRIGTKLRMLQLQGKVERHDEDGVRRWYVAG